MICFCSIGYFLYTEFPSLTEEWSKKECKKKVYKKTYTWFPSRKNQKSRMLSCMRTIMQHIIDFPSIKKYKDCQVCFFFLSDNDHRFSFKKETTNVKRCVFPCWINNLLQDSFVDITWMFPYWKKRVVYSWCIVFERFFKPYTM